MTYIRTIPTRSLILAGMLMALLFSALNCQKKGVIRIRDKVLQIEIADDAAERSRGLMFRKELGRDKGMVFDFKQDQIVSFWMKNTFIPLSIAFLDTNFCIAQIEDMSPLDEENLHRSGIPVRYCIEVNRGWFERNGIKVGDRVEGLQ
ncbi:MAG: DUF192 domain-containing protein [bacterium]|nr:DUF192 domain-containing protein [bacterium]